MVVMAARGWSWQLIVLTAGLVLTEWLDGFLARTLHQESPLGARLDTVADAVFYWSVLMTLAIYDWNIVVGQVVWISAAIVSYGLSWVVGWIKFKRLPSYHTWAAKGSWVVIAIGLLTLIAGWAQWPFHLAMVCVVVANLEAILISLTLGESRVDVPSLWHATRQEREQNQPR